jgi:hypothetical protein
MKRSGMREWPRDRTAVRLGEVNLLVAQKSAPDDFGPWFSAQAGRLHCDFELDL